MLFLLVLAIIVAAVLAMPEVRGWFGEKVTTAGLWRALDKETYCRIDNLIVPSADGTTQIDHVLVSVYGIFVIETKNMKGWIFGSEDNERWTQTLGNRKYTFQNPLRQNYRHTKCLSEYLGLAHRLFHSVVWFIGDCTFKTEMPPNVLASGLVSYLREFTDCCLTEGQVTDIEQRLRELKDSPVATRSEHLQSLSARHESTTNCPRCGSALRRKTARKGRRAGHAFLGYSRYPACQYTRDIADA